MDAEIMLENWCKEKGIDASKVDEDLFDRVVRFMEESISNYVDENKGILLSEHGYLIEQELKDHPEWKLKDSPKVKKTN